MHKTDGKKTEIKEVGEGRGFCAAINFQHLFELQAGEISFDVASSFKLLSTFFPFIVTSGLVAVMLYLVLLFSI